MTDTITLKMPEYAARFLARLLQRQRRAMARTASRGAIHTLQEEAAWDSLDALECSLPDKIFDEEREA